jgi:hypothetical protein
MKKFAEFGFYFLNIRKIITFYYAPAAFEGLLVTAFPLNLVVWLISVPLLDPY